MKTFLIAALLLSAAFTSEAQDLITDSKGQLIFGIPATTLTPTISSNNVGVSFPLPYIVANKYYVENAAGKRYTTMDKASLFFLKVNVVSNTKTSLIFNKKTNYSPSLEFGYAGSIDTLYHPSAKRGTFFTFAISAFAEYQNFRFYDTAIHLFSKHRSNKVSPGVRLSANVFKGTLFALAASASYQNSIVTDNLTSYAIRGGTFFADASISTNGATDGYLAPKLPTDNYRISLSMPNFWLSNRKNKKVPFVVTPYYYGIFTGGKRTQNNMGVVVSILSAPFRKFDRDENGELIDDTKFKFDKSLNIGYNFLSTGNKDPQYFFISGTFNLKVFSPKNPPKEYKQNFNTNYK